MIDVEEISPIDVFRDSLDPAKYPPLDPVYDEDGDMIIPQPMSLENIGSVHRLLDESGRLLTSREAAKRGLGRFIKKQKGRNSLNRRCTCGNKVPCDGNVMITKNERGKLEYHRIARYNIGPAHAWECRQPAQYMTIPSEVNMTELFGGLSPALLHKLSLLTGMSEEEAYALGDARMQNETETQPCSFCFSDRHRFFECPLAQDDSEDTIDDLKRQQLSMQNLLESGTLNYTARNEVEEQLRDCTARIESSKLYAHVSIEKGNQTWEFNAPGVNWVDGEFDMRDVIRITEKLAAAPEGPEVVVPIHFDDVNDAVKQARSGQRIRVLAGEHKWGGTAHVPAYHEGEHYLEIVSDGGVEALPEDGCLHTLTSDGGQGESSILTRTLRMQSYTLLHGLWLLNPSSSGRFVGVSCYSRDGGVPGHHIVRHMHKHEEEPFEVGRRFRPHYFTTVCVTVLDANWSFDHCDVFCLDGTALSLLMSSSIDMICCKVGAAGKLQNLTDGTVEVDEEEGLAYIGIDAEDYSSISMFQCHIQLTQICGLRLQLDSLAVLKSCFLVLNGGMGGCAVAMADHAQANLLQCRIVCGISVSPIWRETAALEASVTSSSRGGLELIGCHVIGDLWLSSRRPQRLKLEDNVVTRSLTRHVCKFVSGREQAIESGMPNPVKLWGDSRYEAWWPLHRLQEIGFEMVSIDTDGTGQRRHVSNEDIIPAMDEADDDAMRIWVNRSKQIELKSWGWEGTLDDVYDTQTPIRDDGRWPTRETDIHEQIRRRVQIQFKRRRLQAVQDRVQQGTLLLQLQNASVESKMMASRQLANTANTGDLVTSYWLRCALQQSSDAQSSQAFHDALKTLEVEDDELDFVQQQLSAMEVDELGDFGDQEILVGNISVPVAAVPKAILSAVWPHWPLYPQEKNAPPGSVTASQGTSLPSEASVKGKKPWESTEKVKKFKLGNASMMSEFTFEQRWQLAEAGFIEFPHQIELVQEIRDRDVDAWFRIMSEKEQERIWIPVLRNYASSMKLDLPESLMTVHSRRKRIESELALTKDYLEALGTSASLHLTESDWRTLYPHLDTKRLINPPKMDKLERVQRRVMRLEAKLSDSLDQEREGLMDVVYPFAKRVERAFDSNDKDEIAKLIKRRGGYSLFGRFVDNNLRPPLALNEDGTRVMFDANLVNAPDI